MLDLQHRPVLTPTYQPVLRHHYYTNINFSSPDTDVVALKNHWFQLNWSDTAFSFKPLFGLNIFYSSVPLFNCQHFSSYLQLHGPPYSFKQNENFHMQANI